MSTEVCPFCCPPEDRIFHRANEVIGIWDAFPVSPGHALLVPCRHVATWFDATPEEQQELLRAVDVARQIIARTYSPDGFNIGINVGRSAGQTVFHLHVHVIPRYMGDVTDPTGGIRGVIPGKANYRSAAVACAACRARLRTVGQSSAVVTIHCSATSRRDWIAQQADTRCASRHSARGG